MQSRLKPPQQVIIATHTLFYGASEALRDFLVSQKIALLVYLGYPLLPQNPISEVEQYVNGKRVLVTKKKQLFAGTPLFYMWDAVRTILACFRLPKEPYVYIGINPLNACVGIILRLFHKVDRVIFYAIDFVPTRSRVPLVNVFYHQLERFAVTYADACWNVSPRIIEGRQRFLGLARTKKDIVVPIGVWGEDIVAKPKKSVSYRLIFVGHLLKKQGVEEVIRALPAIVKKIPKVTLTIIGGGEYEVPLRGLVKQLSLKRQVCFLGWQSDQRVIRKEIAKSDLALATYMPGGSETTNFTYYADPTKIKTYLACGVPVVMTDVSYNAKPLAKAGAGVVVPYDKTAIASTIIRLLSRPSKLCEMKKNARRQAQKFRWDVIFRNAFARL